MSQQREDESLKILTPAPEERLHAWLAEFYGKPVEIEQRHLLRHRDLSCVERLQFVDALPASLIYKQVLPPWDVEQDLHEKILIPSISNSAQLYLSAHFGPLTALFLEDLGTDHLEGRANAEVAAHIGEELAKMHRSYSYRTEELRHTGVLRCIFQSDYEQLAVSAVQSMSKWHLVSDDDSLALRQLALTLAQRLADEPVSLVHGDLYAENIIVRNERLFIIDWSWFTILGVPLMDLATLSAVHHKNGTFSQWRDELIEAYCFESGRDCAKVRELLPYAEVLSRVLFLQWLVERRTRGIFGTTVGPVDNLIPKVVEELRRKQAELQQ